MLEAPENQYQYSDHESQLKMHTFETPKQAMNFIYIHIFLCFLHKIAYLNAHVSLYVQT